MIEEAPIIGTGSRRCGWYEITKAFLTFTKAGWLAHLRMHHHACMHMPTEAAQVRTWEHCFAILQQQLQILVQMHPPASMWTSIFEYELPHERGYYTDMVLLAGSTILVLEFKDFERPQQAHIDQVAGYARDLQHYHAASYHCIHYPLLVLTRSTISTIKQDCVRIVSPEFLAIENASLATARTDQSIVLERWIETDYNPLASLISAAQTHTICLKKRSMVMQGTWIA